MKCGRGFTSRLLRTYAAEIEERVQNLLAKSQIILIEGSRVDHDRQINFPSGAWRQDPAAISFGSSCLFCPPFPRSSIFSVTDAAGSSV